MAENAGNATDKASWLRLAASWLGMIKNEPNRFSANELRSRQQEEGGGDEIARQAWPNPSDEDSKASH